MSIQNDPSVFDINTQLFRSCHVLYLVCLKVLYVMKLQCYCIQARR